MSLTLTQTCPACGNRLRSITEDGTTLVYCGVGRCPSEAAANGVKGDKPVELLARELIVMVEQDDSW